MRFILGPCAIENREIAHLVAAKLKHLSDKYDVEIIYKSCYNKANRTNGKSFRGVGMDEGLAILRSVRNTHKLPVVSDVHSAEEASKAAPHLDYVQVPHTLCRYTSVVEGVAMAMKPIAFKKGSFMTTGQLFHAIQKIRDCGNPKEIILIERGSNIIGSEEHIVDMVNIQKMVEIAELDGNCSVCIDATHSVTCRDHIKTIALAGVAAGADTVFVETHPNPKEALCDGIRSLALDDMEDLIVKCLKVREAIS